MAADERFKEAGLDADKLRDIGDAMLAAQMRCKSGLWARLYYWAVRTFGGLARRFHVVVLSALASLLVGGCAGCLALPDGIFEPSGDEPSYEIVPRDAFLPECPSNAVFCALRRRNAAGACAHVEAPADDCGPF